MNKVEQFIESIFPTQDPKALGLVQGAAKDKKAEAERKEAKSETFWLMFVALATLGVISTLMVCYSTPSNCSFSLTDPSLASHGSWERDST